MVRLLLNASIYIYKWNKSNKWIIYISCYKFFFSYIGWNFSRGIIKHHSLSHFLDSVRHFLLSLIWKDKFSRWWNTIQQLKKQCNIKWLFWMLVCSFVSFYEPLKKPTIHQTKKNFRTSSCSAYISSLVTGAFGNADWT